MLTLLKLGCGRIGSRNTKIGVFSLFTILSANTALADPMSCAESLANNISHYIYSELAPKDPAYLRNAYQMAHKEKEFIGSQKMAPTSLTSLAFQEHLRSLHRILAIGADGTNPFIHPGSGGMRFHTQMIEAGHFRPLKRLAPLEYTFRQSSHREARALPEIIRIIQGRSESNVSWNLQEFTGMLVFRTPIDGVEPERWPTNEAKKDSVLRQIQIKHTYPEDFSPYLNKMHEIYIRLCREFTNSDQDALLRELAQYYHYGINAHLFRRMNHSLLMIQINTFLTLRGWQGNYHSDLDVYATNLSFEEFYPKFLRWFREANP